MSQRRYINEKISILLMCLDSLDLYNLDNLHIAMMKKSYKTKETLNTYHKYYINNKSNYSIQKTLYLLQIINDIILEEHLKEKIHTILSDYSSCSSTHAKIFSLTTSQYLNRFMYKYQIFYKYNLRTQINTTSKLKHKLYDIAIINLYILNKILSKNGPYILYKYLHLNKLQFKI